MLTQPTARYRRDMEWVVAISVQVEIGLLLVAWYAHHRDHGLTPTLSLTYGIVSLLATLSFAAQAVITARMAPYAVCVDAIGCVWALRIAGKHRAILRADHQYLVDCFQSHRLLTGCVILFLGYLGLQALLLSPMNNDSLAYNLARVLFCIQENTLFPENGTALHQQVFPLGYDIIHFWILRYGTDLGIGIFGLLCYLGILAGTYSHVLTRNNRRVALQATLVVGTMLEIVLMATSTKNDLPCGTLALTSLVAMAAYNRDGKRIHLVMVGLALAFGIAVKTYFVGWAGLICLYGAWIMLRHQPTGSNVIACLVRLPLVIPRKIGPWPIFVFVAAMLFYGVTAVRFGHPFGPEEFRESHGNQDGWRGASINACRYAVQQLQWPRLLGGEALTVIHDRLLGKNAQVGTMADIQVDLAGPARAILPQEDLSWYGLTSWLFIIPAACWTLKKGHDIDRAATALCVVFAGMICAGIGWAPWNGRFFVTVFACAGFWIRGPLERLIQFTKLRTILVAICITQGLFTAMLNIDKPLVDVYGLVSMMEQKTGRGLLNRRGVSAQISTCVPYWLIDVLDRDRHYNELFGNDFVTSVKDHVTDNDRLAIIASGSSVYPFLRNLDLPRSASLSAFSEMASFTPRNVDVILLLGQAATNTIDGFVRVATSDMNVEDCQRGVLWKRDSP